MGARSAVARLRSLAGVGLALAGLSLAPSLHAQSVSAPALKAAFLLNFARFVEWPIEALPRGAVLLMCVAGDDAVASALEDTVKGHAIFGHLATVRRLVADRPLLPCHLLYLSNVTQPRAMTILEELSGAAVLTVSDAPRFAERGGVVAFFVENDKLRFDINPDAARRQRVYVSSKLLNLARLVKDDPYATHR